MTALELYELMKLGGYSLRVQGESLIIKESRWIDDELESLIKEHKAELIQLIRDDAG